MEVAHVSPLVVSGVPVNRTQQQQMAHPGPGPGQGKELNSAHSNVDSKNYSHKWHAAIEVSTLLSMCESVCA